MIKLDTDLDTGKIARANQQVQDFIDCLPGPISDPEELPLDKIFYCPNPASEMCDNPAYKRLMKDYHDEHGFSTRSVDGLVVFHPIRRGPLYVVELRISRMVIALIRKGTLEVEQFDMSVLGIPDSAFDPFQHLVVGANQTGTVLHTQDYEGSGWSLHLG